MTPEIEPRAMVCGVAEMAPNHEILNLATCIRGKARVIYAVTHLRGMMKLPMNFVANSGWTSMNAKIVKRPGNLEDNPRVISPPVIQEPLYQCAISVTVTSYEVDAKIEIDVDGTVTSASGGFPVPNGVTIGLPVPLVAGQKVKARQNNGTATSSWTKPILVGDHTADFPAGPPRPVINPAPVYKCGVRTGVSNLLPGGTVRITADAVKVGEVKGCSNQQGVDVTPAYALNQKVQAFFELCKDPSSPSIEHTTVNPPSPLPTPTIDTTYAGGRSVTVRGIVNGATVSLARNGVPVGTWPCWGGSITIGGLAVFASLEKFTAVQQLCPGDPSSPPGESPVQPCSSLPPPQIGPVQAGDTKIVATHFVPDATIKVFVNGVQAGASGGPVVNLNVTLKKGDTVIVVQDVEGCKGQSALEVKVLCVDPPVVGDPSGLNLFPVGQSEYSVGKIKGSVYYPAEADGKDQPFHKRLARLGRTPIVFLLHGNHERADPSYLGYDYFQIDLAKMGFIAVSVDQNALNASGGGVQNILDRADLLIDNIAHFQTLDATAASVFHGKIDFARLGLMGHSRGGDAVVETPTLIGLPGVTIRAVLALAPTNNRYWAGLPTVVPKGYAFQTILPAGDGDVRDNNGAQFYDQAKPGPFKSQLYVHYTNHNFFNRRWAKDDSLNFPQPAVVSRADHERILTVYGCAHFRATLLGHNTAQYLSGDLLPAGVLAQHVFRSFESAPKVMVDHHEDGNTIAVNSLGQPTSQTAGMVADEFPFDRVPGAFKTSFYGLSTGMIVAPKKKNGIFRSQLKTAIDVTKREIWIRGAEVTDGSTVAASGTGFELGLEDENGVRAWVDSDDVGGLARPYPRNPGMIKTMLSTIRFRGVCFQAVEFNPKKVVAILIRCNRDTPPPIAFDDLQIY